MRQTVISHPIGTYRHLLYLGAWALMATACGALEDAPADEAWLEPSGSGGLGRIEQPIAGGVVDNGHPSTGVVLPSGCSANLIGDRTVLTACHCLYYNAQRVRFCSEAFGAGNCVWGTAYAGPNCNPANYSADRDLAYVRLDQSYRALYGVVPSRISSTVPVKDAPLTAVGFGCTDWDGSGPGYGTKRYAHSDIDSVKSWRITFDENSPYGGLMGCDGDSGGPVFRGLSGDCQIATIAGRGYVLFNWYTEGPRVDRWYAWIQDRAGDPSVLRCNQTVCGDGICHAQERCWSCRADCGRCPPPPPPPTCYRCPDGTCCEDQSEPGICDVDGRFCPL